MRASDKQPYFGPSKAGLVLQAELDKLNDKKIAGKVGRIFGNFSYYLNQLEGCDHCAKLHFSHLLLRETEEEVKDKVEWPGNIRTLLLNVIRVAYHRHTSWKVEVASKSNNQFGQCSECKEKAVIRYFEMSVVKAKYCGEHRGLVLKWNEMIREELTGSAK